MRRFQRSDQNKQRNFVTI